MLADVASFAFVTRGKDYHLLDHPLIQARLHLPPDQFQQRPESSMVRSLYDCPEIPVGPEGMPCRVVVATHPAGKKKSPVGVTRAPTRLRTVLHEPAATRLHHLRCGRVVSASRRLMAPCECAGLGSSHLLLVFFTMRLWVPIA